MKRRIVNKDLSLSEFTFSSIRLLKQNISVEDAKLLIRKAIEYGIVSFHSSFEYESYDYFKAIFCDVKKDFQKKI